jgi:energy-coupling factor transporter ATP-binding protein EcfA2
VIIGENGTGKTHLLKAAYALYAGPRLYRNKPDTSGEELEAALTAKFLRLFMPLEDKLGKIHRQGAIEQANLFAQFAHGQEVTATFFNNSRSLAIRNKGYKEVTEEAVFIPTKEVLSFMKGFNSLYEKYGLSFDQTYQDICLLLDLPEVRPETLHEKSKWAMAEIEGICGGRFIFYGGGKVTFKTGNAEYSANSMAEGFRKAGILSRLLETGAIQPGVSGPLFWDEPESNLNPKLIKLLVQILLELSRNGQQIILATHDYVLLKWFDLLMDKGKDDHVRFHSLYRDAEISEIRVASTEDYLKITPNPIDEAFGFLINQEIENDMGGLGK